MLNIEEIQNMLPQRFPFLFIDRVIQIDPGKKIVAIKNVSINEQFFSGHFPGKPIMPGVLIIEAMAQAAIIFVATAKCGTKEKKMSYYLGGVKMRFLHPVFAGDQIQITIEPIKMVSSMAIINAQAEVRAQVVAKGEISLSAKENE